MRQQRQHRAPHVLVLVALESEHGVERLVEAGCHKVVAIAEESACGWEAGGRRKKSQQTEEGKTLEQGTNNTDSSSVNNAPCTAAGPESRSLHCCTAES